MLKIPLMSSGMKMIDDFEDGDVSDWSGDTGSFSAVSNISRHGSYCAQLNANGKTNSVNLDSLGNLMPHNLLFSVYIGSDVGASNDSVRIEVQDSSSNQIFQLRFEDSTKNIEINSTDTGSNWSVSTWVDIEIKNIDFSSQTFDLFIDGTVRESDVSFSQSASNFDNLVFRNGTYWSGSDRDAYIDYIYIK